MRRLNWPIPGSTKAQTTTQQKATHAQKGWHKLRVKVVLASGWIGENLFMKQIGPSLLNWRDAYSDPRLELQVWLSKVKHGIDQGSLRDFQNNIGYCFSPLLVEWFMFEILLEQRKGSWKPLIKPYHSSMRLCSYLKNDSLRRKWLIVVTNQVAKSKFNDNYVGYYERTLYFWSCHY